jgi:hypothetical protein
MASNSGDVVTFSKASSEVAENRAADVRKDVYKQTGVDTAEADAGLAPSSGASSAIGGSKAWRPPPN